MPRTTMATLLAEIETLRASVATLTNAPVAPSAASSHFKARDLPCTWPTPCVKTFRTVKGQTFHATQTTHAKGK